MIDSKKMDELYYYDGKDLGCNYQKEATTFRVWSPIAERVDLNLYEAGDGDCLMETIPMMLDVKGTWYTKVAGDLAGKYYTYTVKTEQAVNEVIDVYAKAAGINGKRAMVLDFATTDPEQWEQDHYMTLEQSTDAIIYELHVRDLSADDTSGIQQKYLFAGLTEEGTKSPDGLATGLDHIKELGVTHVHLLPLHDYGSVDEAHPELQKFNWGYDPVNYSVLEGSYSSDPFHGEVRVKEFKKVVQCLHNNGIGVVMDVVYNHTYQSYDSVFEKTVPGYYYRMKDGKFANASGCGNETASEHKMMRKFMIDSLCFWAKEYHIDGFRFDLMGIHDVDTMNAISKELKKINPNILLYGEGWAAEPPAYDAEKLAMKLNAKKVPDFAMFSDNIRDVVRGHIFTFDAKGFVNGKEGLEEDLKSAVVGSVHHSQTRNGKESGWAGNAAQSVNYISAHDDLSLWDRISVASGDETEETRIAMNKLAAAILFTSQGIPFIQAGEEMLRTKPGTQVAGKFTSNSYNAPDSINSLKWDRKKTYQSVVEYYKGLIAFRKEHAALRMVDAGDMEEHLQFLDVPKNVVAYTIQRPSEKETLQEICIVYNANQKATIVDIPKGEWKVFVDKEQAGTDSLRTIQGGSMEVEPISVLVLGR